jgi:hypothetical protein
VIDGNGEGVMFSGSSGYASSENVVANNILSNSKVRWNVESSWSSGRIGSANVARYNCVFASNTRSSGWYNERGGIAKEWGFKSVGNRIADPQFVNRDAKDFRVQQGSPCETYGPGTIPTKRRG